MQNNIAIARPYARAIFELAKENDKLKELGNLLQALAIVAKDEQVVLRMAHPEADANKLAVFFLNIAKGLNLNFELGDRVVNFLAAKHRLNCLPEIANIFEQYRLEVEKLVKVKIISAKSLESNQLEKFTTALKKRLGLNVTIENQEDRSLIAGAIVKAGDMIIDGSVRGKLTKMADALMA